MRVANWILAFVAAAGLPSLAAAQSPANGSVPAALDPAGRYDFEAVTPNGIVPGRIVIEGTPGHYAGVLAPQGMGIDSLTSVEARDNELVIRAIIPEAGGETTLRLTFTGEMFKGMWTSVDGGSGLLTGSRLPR